METTETTLKPIWKEGYTQNRELSWLNFNARILEEASDPNVPLLERLQFLSIFTTNLDEFFMVRVGSLCEQAAVNPMKTDAQTGMTATQQMSRIYAQTGPLYKRRAKIYSAVAKEMKAYGIRRVSMQQLKVKELEFVEAYFESIVRPCLSPYIVQPQYPFPHVENKRMYVVASLSAMDGSECHGLIPVPAHLPEIVFLPKSHTRFLATEDVILHYVEEVFPLHEVKECTLFCVTRNADVPLDYSKVKSGDAFRAQMKKLLQKRTRANVVRLELARPVSKPLTRYLCSRFEIARYQIFQTRAPIRLQYIEDLRKNLPAELAEALSAAPYTPREPAMCEGQPLWQAAQEHDVLLSYPYESMEPFLQMLRQAAHDHEVTEIGISLYRIATQARLAEYLCAAAENGKHVTILMELRARFDERNNIDWSERFEEAGCQVIYGAAEYKVHAKVCSIVRRNVDETRYLTYIGTGNFNEKTAKQYTDVALVTADATIGREAVQFFETMRWREQNASYQTLLVAPAYLKPRILARIAAERDKGWEGFIFMKMNSLTDVDIIRALSEASCAGARVRLVVRGICCLLPGIPGKTENIEVRSIVGRFLEHARIFWFGKMEDARAYISSADMMTRNTQKRVEVACPITDTAVRMRVWELLETAWADTYKARKLTAQGTYEKLPVFDGAPRVISQEVLMQSDIVVSAQADTTSPTTQ